MYDHGPHLLPRYIAGQDTLALSALTWTCVNPSPLPYRRPSRCDITPGRVGCWLLAPTSFIKVEVDLALHLSMVYLPICSTSLRNTVVQVCMETYGMAPEVVVSGEPKVSIPYIPAHLDYMLYELLKNAMRYGFLRHSVHRNSAFPFQLYACFLPARRIALELPAALCCC